MASVVPPVYPRSVVAFELAAVSGAGGEGGPVGGDVQISEGGGQGQEMRARESFIYWGKGASSIRARPVSLLRSIGCTFLVAPSSALP